jgi:hypothetical protein
MNIPAAMMILDLTRLLAVDLHDPVQIRRLWDETHFAVSVQGIVNRDGPRLYLRYLAELDDFWWTEMTAPGAWLEGTTATTETDVAALLAHFGGDLRGAVVWDERVPATSNLASTIAGIEDLAVLRFDETPGSLYHRLVIEGGLEVRVRLMAEDGGPMFTGSGTIPGTNLPSTGSAKNDAHRWMIETIVKPGRANPRVMGYYIDGHWLQSGWAGWPANHTLTNQDYVIAKRGVFWDLHMWDDEAPVDDPGQRPGTDVETLHQFMRATIDQAGIESMIHVAGYVPWRYKYTDVNANGWNAGGGRDGVATEWKCTEILSAYNGYLDADALDLSAMVNASVFMHCPAPKTPAANPRPTRESLIARGVLTADGSLRPVTYRAHYVGDYDAAAWLYQNLPRLWKDARRGELPLAWAFNPNLAERFAFGMRWARERRTENDFFVAGDSGAGYVNVAALSEPRIHSGLPSGWPAWEAHNKAFFATWNLDVVGFVLDGFLPVMGPEGFDAYARFSPGGIVLHRPHPDGRKTGVHGDLPFVTTRGDLSHDVREAARFMASDMPREGLPAFHQYRSILRDPTWYAQLESELEKIEDAPPSMLVDLPTLLWLVREAQGE